MAHDLVIRGGTVVDGTGAGPRLADLAVDNGLVTAVGAVDAPGNDEIDARGLTVTPGFVDAHTHYDAQLGWDPFLTPSSWHGVTTTLIGNCGMTFAPVRPGEGWRLAQMMETVEDIPADAILETLPWTWESYGEYLDYVESGVPALNVAGMVGHCAVRYYVMGDRAVDEQATETEIAAMAAMVSDALDQGAVGFSTSRFLGHMLRDRRHVPGTHASRDEVLAIAAALDGRGLFQAVLNSFDLDADMDLVTEAGLRSGGPVLVTAVAVESPSDGSPSVVKQPTPPMLEAAAARGAAVTATLLPRAGGSVSGLFARVPWRTPAWLALSALPHDERLAAIRDSATRRRLIDEADGARPMASARRIYFMGDDVVSYVPDADMSLASMSGAAGESPAETFLRLTDASEGRAMFSVVSFNRDQEVLRGLLASERMLPGLGDAGAHLSGVMDASYSTSFLTDWSRDSDLMPIGEAIRRLTSAPADLLGLTDRGRLTPGAAADVNVIELDSLAALPVEVARDAPLGASRLIQRGRGYRHTLVNGRTVVVDGAHTGARPGRVLRRTG
jgi:N-acyl-D-amino-acid deacylase